MNTTFTMYSYDGYFWNPVCISDKESSLKATENIFYGDQIVEAKQFLTANVIHLSY